MWRRASIACVIGLVVAGCGSDGGSGGGFEADPSVLPGMNPYVYTWEETAEGESTAEGRDYLLYVPDEHLEDPGEPWPLVLSLHGWPTPDLDALAAQGLPSVVRSTPYRFIMAAPLATSSDVNNPGWAWLHSADYLVGFIDHIGTLVNVDPDRIYVTGGSWGATGAWALASAYPDLPAAVVTVAGGWNDRCFMCRWPDDWTGQFPDNVCDMKDIPAWLFHGEWDTSIPPEASQAMVDALRACGSDVKFTLRERIGHQLVAFDDPAVIEWMLAQGADGDWPALPGG